MKGLTQSLQKTQDRAWIELSNLYLNIESYRIFLNRFQYNQLNDLLNRAYAWNDTMIRTWWEHEFWKLPNWNNV